MAQPVANTAPQAAARTHFFMIPLLLD